MPSVSGTLGIRSCAVLALASLLSIGAWQLRDPETFSDALGSLQPAEAEVYGSLTIVEARLNEAASEWVLRIRNDDWRTITAWAIDSMVGTDEGTSHVLTRSIDRFLFTHEHDENPALLPLRPGDETRFVVATPAPIDARPERFAQGSYDVASLQVSFVVFDDGTYAGNPPHERLHDFYLQRLDHLQALATFHEGLSHLAQGRENRLEEPLRTLLESPRPASDEGRLPTPPLPPSDSSAASQARLHAHATALIESLALQVAASDAVVTDLSRSDLRAVARPVAKAMLLRNQRLLELGTSRMPTRLRRYVTIIH